MNLAWAVRILGDGGQEGRRVAPSKTGPFAARQEGLINTFQQLTAGDEDPPNGDKSLAGGAFHEVSLSWDSESWYSLYSVHGCVLGLCCMISIDAVRQPSLFSDYRVRTSADFGLVPS